MHILKGLIKWVINGLLWDWMSQNERQRHFHHHSHFTLRLSAEYQSVAFAFTLRERVLVSDTQARVVVNSRSNVFASCTSQHLVTVYKMSKHWSLKESMSESASIIIHDQLLCCKHWQCFSSKCNLKFHFPRLLKTHRSHQLHRRNEAETNQFCGFLSVKWKLLQHLQINRCRRVRGILGFVPSQMWIVQNLL